MKRTVSGFALLCCSFSAFALFAKVSPKPFVIPKDQQAMSIVQSALTALGGFPAIATHSDSLTVATATIYSPTLVVPVTVKTKGSREMRSEAQMSKGMMVRILNNGQAVLQRPDGKVQKLSMKNTVGERVEHIPLFSMLSEYEEADVGVVYKGVSQVKGQTDEVVALSYIPSTNPGQGPLFAAATQTLFYINQRTGLIDKMQYVNHEEHDHTNFQTVEVYFSNYQAVDGIAIPFNQTTYADGKIESVLRLKSVTFNTGIADSEFAFPQ